MKIRSETLTLFYNSKDLHTGLNVVFLRGMIKCIREEIGLITLFTGMLKFQMFVGFFIN